MRVTPHGSEGEIRLSALFGARVGLACNSRIQLYACSRKALLFPALQSDRLIVVPSHLPHSSLLTVGTSMAYGRGFGSRSIRATRSVWMGMGILLLAVIIT